MPTIHTIVKALFLVASSGQLIDMKHVNINTVGGIEWLHVTSFITSCMLVMYL